MSPLLYILSAPIIPIDPTKPIDTDTFTANAAEGTYEIAHLIMKIVDWLLDFVGLGHNETLVTGLYATVVFFIAMVAGKVFQWIILYIVRQIARHWDNDVYLSLTSVHFFTKLCRIIPAIVFLILIQFTLTTHTVLASVLTKITLLYIIFLVCIALSALILAIWQHVDTRENKRKLPLKGLAQLAKGIIWIIAIIISIALLIDKSPASLLAGLGAFAAVLMLIFKDSILGLVAGVQLSENDSLHVGDWIKVNGTDANGTVTEVSLTSVKVLNWDKTTTNLPPYSLISGSFTNYRSMQESHTRRICRSFMIDADSILPTTDAMLADLRKLPFLDEWIGKKIEQRQRGITEDVNNSEGLVDGSIDTNLGVFRAYMKMWLDANPDISHDSDCFVTSLAQTAAGIPFQVYCFTDTSAWFAYEHIQDTVFEHLASMLRFFSLYTFENPSGRDTVIDGYLSPGKDITKVYGIPYPFFQRQETSDTHDDNSQAQTSDNQTPEAS